MTNGELWDVAIEEGSDKFPDATFVEEELWDESRWSLWHRVVLYHEPTDSWWAGCYETPATEMQEVDNDNNVSFERVWPKVIAKTIYLNEKQWKK